uniref:Uncharacterized protein n=1 Tax=Timema cristinae TaxID=61476 RepID=A0A7R9D9E0_TIMCR|nr:unnamed protein product [Timema cristinae]
MRETNDSLWWLHGLTRYSRSILDYRRRGDQDLSLLTFGNVTNEFLIRVLISSFYDVHALRHVLAKLEHNKGSQSAKNTEHSSSSYLYFISKVRRSYRMNFFTLLILIVLGFLFLESDDNGFALAMFRRRKGKTRYIRRFHNIPNEKKIKEALKIKRIKGYYRSHPVVKRRPTRAGLEPGYEWVFSKGEDN